MHTSNAPTKDAVALAYLGAGGRGGGAPRVVARGHGLVAEEIIARAREHGVFIHESKELVGLLMQVDLDDEIPAALYRAVAELLAWLYRIQAGLEVAPGSVRTDPQTSLTFNTDQLDLMLP